MNLPVDSEKLRPESFQFPLGTEEEPISALSTMWKKKLPYAALLKITTEEADVTASAAAAAARGISIVAAV